MPLLIWGAMFEVGVAEIDQQHCRLVEMANELADAVRDGKGIDVLTHVYDGLLQYTQSHFATEERLMARCRYGDTQEHLREHQELTQAVNDFRRRLSGGQPELAEEAMRFFTAWLSRHIMGTDKALARTLRAHGIS